MAKYVYGSEAPQINTQPQKVVRRVSRTGNVPEKDIKGTGIGGAFTLFILIAVGVMLISAVNYISAQNQKRVNARQIKEITAELSTTKEKNDLKQLSIDTSLSGDYIYRVAVEELGMVYASPDQVIKYNSGESEYVIQYSNIPEQ